jgi:hypothetical protein
LTNEVKMKMLVASLRPATKEMHVTKQYPKLLIRWTTANKDLDFNMLLIYAINSTLLLCRSFSSLVSQRKEAQSQVENLDVANVLKRSTQNRSVLCSSVLD